MGPCHQSQIYINVSKRPAYSKHLAQVGHLAGHRYVEAGTGARVRLCPDLYLAAGPSAQVPTIKCDPTGRLRSSLDGFFAATVL